MRTHKRSMGVVACCVLLIGAGWVLAQDWPQWRGPNRDGLVSGFTAPQTWPKELTQKWKTTVGLGDSTPALVGEISTAMVAHGVAPGQIEVEITEVIDHHKLGNSHSNAPIAFITSPVGSTCTLVAGRYRECGIEPEQKIAALLLAGILSDTVILKSPTTTEIDRETATWLEGPARVSAADFGRDIFAACSSLKNYGTVERVVTADFKLFKHEKHRIGVGQVEIVLADGL